MIEQDFVKLSDLKWGDQLIFPTSRSLRNTPHFIGARYPCRSVAYVPRMILADLDASTGLAVLDPFMGSGTTAIEAAKCAAKIYGLEVDPYARLIATVGARKYTEVEILELKLLLKDILLRASKQHVDKACSPRLKNIDYWFYEENFSELLKLKTSIVRCVSETKYRDFFLTAFGDIIRATSKAERQSLKPYISTKYTKIPKSAMTEFERIASKYIEAVSATRNNDCDGIHWVDGDATNFSLDSSVDVAISSPPYLNAMDYTRCIKLESAWVGTGNDESIQTVRQQQLGEAVRRRNERRGEYANQLADKYFHDLKDIDLKRFDTLIAYFDDMERNLRCTFRALKPNKSYFIIMGDSQVRGIPIPTHKILAELGQMIGFEWCNYFQYPIRDHRTSIPRGNQGGKIEEEHVIELKKPSKPST